MQVRGRSIQLQIAFLLCCLLAVLIQPLLQGVEQHRLPLLASDVH
jgi:hypothetical protein